MPKTVKKGIFFAFLTAVISGFSIFYNKMVVIKGIDSLVFNILKNGGVALIISFFLILNSKLPNFTKLKFSDWKKLFLIGFIGGSLPFILYFEGLKTVSAINANLIHKTLFIWVAVFAISFLREKLNFWQIIGYLIVAWSNLLLPGFSGFKGNSGEFLILGATLLWSIENLIAKIALKNLDSSLVAWGRMTFGTFFLILVAIIQGKLGLIAKIPADYFLSIIGSIIFLSGYVLTWYKALKMAPVTVVTSVLILSTPITNILSTIFLNRHWQEMPISNIALTFLGLLLIVFFAPWQKNFKKQIAKN